MPVISSGQITIIDLYDAPSLNSWISASQNTVQTYNNTTQAYSPNYGVTNQVLTCNLTKAGSVTSLIGAQVANIKWYKTVGATKTEITSTATADNEYMSGTSRSILTVKNNTSTTQNAIIYTAEGAWTDPATALPVSFSAQIPITVVQLAKAAIIGTLTTPDGDIFRNNTPATLKLNADLYKDGALSAGSKKFKWFAADTAVSTTGHASYDADGGIGWRKLTVVSPTAGKEVVNIGFDTATDLQGVLTITSEAVNSAQTYKVVITDNIGGTSGLKVTDYATIKDLDDPVMVIIDSSGGTVLKNGLGSTVLKARLWQNGVEIDTAPTYAYTYSWTRWQDNALDAAWGTKTGKEITVGSVDVDSKTMFKCEVSK